MRDEETLRFEALLRRRGTDPAGNPSVEKEIFERYADDCAVMILDASGFTRCTQENGIIHYASLIVAMRDALQPILGEHRALSHWAEADNLYAVFPTAREALECALEIRRANARTCRESPGETLAVCIGIGAGRMLRVGNRNVFGDQMNQACKLGEDVANPGEILITESAWAIVGGHFEGMGSEPLRTHISGVELVYRRVKE